MEAALAISRVGQFAAVMLVFGSSLFRLRFAPESERRVFGPWYRSVLIAAAIITLVSSLAWLDVEAGTMSGEWSNAANPHTVATVLYRTSFGQVWQLNLAAAAILLCVVFAPAKIQHLKSWSGIVVGLSALLIATSTWTGHAVMHGGLMGDIHPFVQVVHVLAAATWLGSLPALGFALHSLRKPELAAQRSAAQHLLRGYSRMGYLAVGLVLLTGCIDTWFMVDSFGALFSTSYGRILVAKISLFLLMMGVAAVNRFVLTPTIMHSGSNVTAAEASLRQLRRTVVLEQILGVSIIVLVSVLGTVAPPMPGHMEM
ncbi:MAG: copper homeostasis membrane protein CopD [Rhodospirillales bacterium]|nr:copper homeostasis membrane protein CopD [Rhodospirillales bacterium]MBN8925892.1 copper homeostasis membrane protein CopD [Rhodospirillales bacterium]